MILRWLAREFRDFPATSFFCLTWIAVFAAMTYVYLASGASLSLSRWLIFGFGGGGRFGDFTLNDLRQGQVWRLVTCNFVHYSLIHIALNLLALYQLGSIVESWYGPHQFIFLYGLTGIGGNLVSAICRLQIGSNRAVHSAGGSVVIMGLVGLVAVAGWRSGTRDDKRLSLVMLLFIALTAILGMIFPRFIDNWGHAGGLLVGFVAGLAHRKLMASVTKPSAWGSSVLMSLVIVGSAAAQFVVDRREAPGRLERILAGRSEDLVHASAALNRLRRPDHRKEYAKIASKWLNALDQTLDGPVVGEVEGLIPLVHAAEERQLSDEEAKELEERLARALAALRRRYEEDRRQLRRLRAMN